ncbi:MAG: DUF4124 domain-containing protein [Abyssibacter sp.]|uniref:DUF4124 domain-containing protein n=1 Tax=Abyssibacter sp. TaxID=2320200 RepID=UPI00321C09FE
MTRAAIVLITLLWPFLAEAVGVYRWVDAAGRVHYSDMPVTNAERVNAALLQSREVKPRPVDGIPPSFREQVQTDCALARDRLALYSRATEVFEQTATGVTYRLSPARQQARLEELQAARHRYCRAGAAEQLWRTRKQQAQAAAASAGQGAAPSGRAISRN